MAVAAAILFVFCLVLFIQWRWLRAPKIHAVFGLDKSWKLLSCDIGGKKGSYYRFGPVGGVPDAVFRRGHHLRVYDLKKRRKPSFPSKYERFQMTLYLGILKAKFRTLEVRAFLAYEGGQIEVTWNEALYANLVARIPDLLRVKKQLRI